MERARDRYGVNRGGACVRKWVRACGHAPPKGQRTKSSLTQHRHCRYFTHVVLQGHKCDGKTTCNDIKYV